MYEVTCSSPISCKCTVLKFWLFYCLAFVKYCFGLILLPSLVLSIALFILFLLLLLFPKPVFNGFEDSPVHVTLWVLFPNFDFILYT